MRERVTFVHRPEDAWDPSLATVVTNSITLGGLPSSTREDQWTWSLEELPQEIWRALKPCQTLHLQWQTDRIANVAAWLSPFNARVPPGLHVSVDLKANASSDLLCPILKRAFGDELACDSLELSFISPPNNGTDTPIYQFYQLTQNLLPLETYLYHRVCSSSKHVEACRARLALLRNAKALDIAFDAVTRTLRAQIISSSAQIDTSITIAQLGSSSAEIGVFQPAEAASAESLSLSGFLAVLGKDEKLRPTQFSFPARHHADPTGEAASFQASFQQPTGLHPTLRLDFSPQVAAPSSSSDSIAGAKCSLYAYLTLPSTVFVDKYQLAAPLFLASKRLRRVHSLYGEADLEAPEWAVTRWGSTVLVELDSPSSSTSGSEAAAADSKGKESWTAEIPLHLRYLRPKAGGMGVTSITWPSVIWACPTRSPEAEPDPEEGPFNFHANPFDRTHLGYDDLLGPDMIYHHVRPANHHQNEVMNRLGHDLPLQSESMVATLAVPVLDLQQSAWVVSGTALVLIGGCAWVLWRLVLVGLAVSAGPRPTVKKRL